MEEKVLSENPFKVILKNLILEVIISVILLVVLALLLSHTDLDENIISPSIIFISAFSILIGGFLTSKKLRIKGIVSGGIEGIAYMLILYLSSSICSADFSIGIEGIVMIGIGVLAGMIGGIFGANLRSKN